MQGQLVRQKETELENLPRNDISVASHCVYVEQPFGVSWGASAHLMRRETLKFASAQVTPVLDPERRGAGGGRGQRKLSFSGRHRGHHRKGALWVEMGRVFLWPRETPGTVPTSRPPSEGHTHAWAPDTRPAGRGPGWTGSRWRRAAADAAQRLCRLPGRPRTAHTPAPWPRRPLSLGEGHPLRPSCNRRKYEHEPPGPESGGPATLGARPGARSRARGPRAPATPSPRGSAGPGPLPAEPGPRGSRPAWGRAAFRAGRGDTHPLGAAAAPSSPAALGRSRRRGGAGPAAPARPPEPRGSARPRRRQLAPRERPGRGGHAPGRRRGRAAGARAAGVCALAAGGWTALRAAAAARARPARRAFPHPAAALRLRQAARGAAAAGPGEGRLRRKDRAAWAPALAEPGTARVRDPRAARSPGPGLATARGRLGAQDPDLFLLRVCRGLAKCPREPQTRGSRHSHVALKKMEFHGSTTTSAGELTAGDRTRLGGRGARARPQPEPRGALAWPAAPDRARGDAAGERRAKERRGSPRPESERRPQSPRSGRTWARIRIGVVSRLPPGRILQLESQETRRALGGP